MNKIYIGIIIICVIVMIVFAIDIFFLHPAQSAPIIEVGGFI